MSMEFSRHEYWSGLPCPAPGDLPNPGIEPGSICLLLWQAGSLPLVPPGKSSESSVLPQSWQAEGLGVQCLHLFLGWWVKNQSHGQG